jgi:hypothetical protein
MSLAVNFTLQTIHGQYGLILTVLEKCTFLGCYAVSSGNFMPMFRTTYQSLPQGSAIQKKIFKSNMKFIQGRSWVVKRLSSTVSTNRVAASSWMEGRGGSQCSCKTCSAIAGILTCVIARHRRTLT